MWINFEISLLKEQKALQLTDLRCLVNPLGSLTLSYLCNVIPQGNVSIILFSV